MRCAASQETRDDVTVVCPQRDNLPRGPVLLRGRDTGMSLRQCHAMARTLHPAYALPGDSLS